MISHPPLPQISFDEGSLELEEEMQMNERKLSIPQRIEQRAYELYLERGGEHGHDRADWLTAENDLTELPEQSNSGATKASTAAAALQATSPKGARVAQKVPVEIVER